MMNDDEKRTQDVKEAEVIDLDAAREKKEAAQADADKPADSKPAQVVSLSDAIATFKAAFSDVKNSLEPLRNTFKEISEAAKNGAEAANIKAAEEAAKENAEAGADNAEEKSVEEMSELEFAKKRIADAARGMTSTGKAVSESAEIVNLAFERLKRQGVEKKIDLRNVFTEQFADYADKNLKDGDYTVDEDGKKVVTVNAKFLQEHASEAIPSILGGIANSFVRTMFGDVLGIQDAIDKANAAQDAKTDENADDAAKADDATKAGDAEKAAEPEVEAAAEPKESPYRVQFDFAKLFGDLMKTATITATNSKAAEGEEEFVREAAIKSAKLIEDGLNGKPVDPNDLKIEVEPAAPDTLTPEEIQPLDDKHQRILELAREYDQALKGDENDDDKK